KKAFVDKAKERRVRRYIICIVILTMCPAIYLTIGIIKSTVYNANADKFVAEQLMNFTNTQLVSKKIDSDKREIRVVLVGANVSETSIIIARSRLNSYELRGTKLVVMQGLDNQKVDLSTVKDKVMHDFYKSSERQLNIQQRQIDSLNLSLTKYKKFAGISRTIIPELKVFYPSVSFLSISQAYETSADLMRTDTVTFAVLKSSKRPTEKEKHKISEWVKARLGVKNLRLIVE
ncbi:MAG: TIGR00341 family protein, partial [Bacteroidaceae bacterium]